MQNSAVYDQDEPVSCAWSTLLLLEKQAARIFEINEVDHV